jgi:hypothetical protein
VNSPSSSTAINTEYSTTTTIKIASSQAQPSNPPVIDLDTDNTQSELTSLHSGETPTLPGEEAPIIKALENAATDTEYELLVAQIPREYKIRISGTTFIRYNPY